MWLFQFAILLLVIFLLEIAGGVAAYILRNKVETCQFPVLGNNELRFLPPPAPCYSTFRIVLLLVAECGCLMKQWKCLFDAFVKHLCFFCQYFDESMQKKHIEMSL